MAKVSVIIPVYNVEDRIGLCIESVTNQSYDNTEIVLIDDGSTDKSGIICDSYAESDARIKVIHKENGGVSDARNQGIKCSTGDYIMFLDGDDTLDTNTIESCINEIKNGDFDIAVFGYHMFLQKNNMAEYQNDVTYEAALLNNKQQVEQEFGYCYKKGVYDFITDKIFKASIIKNNNLMFNGYFNTGGEDAVFMISLLPFINSIKITPYAFYNYYRRENESMTKSFHPEKFSRYIRRLDILHDIMCKFNCPDISFLADEYCKYFLWSYEDLFLKSCKMNKFQRLHYIKNTYSKTPSFLENIKLVANGKTIEKYCYSSVVAAKLFLKKRLRLLGLWHIISILKFRSNNE
ncbi:MAG: glycosyltransferase family 2 protein [Clostridia bacterium]|nr:glycosyltransferase family 2 protein [Clostridia bacterium]